MKALFASLLCLVFSAAQCFAVKGGPDYGGGGVGVVGTYAGVLQGFFDPTNPNSGNSLGVFTLGVPQTGSATGSFIMFARGRTFNGTIEAAADPSKGSLKGVVSATYDYNLQTVSNGQVVSVPVTATVNGPINATTSTSRANLFTASAVLLRGDATLYVSGGYVNGAGDPVINEILLLKVNGFKQSSSAPTAAAPTG